MDCTGRTDVLYVHPGAVAGFCYQPQKGVHIVCFQCLGLSIDPFVFPIDMHGSQDCPVRYRFLEFGQCFHEVGFRDLAQVILTKKAAKRFRFPGNGGVFIGQIRMICAAVDDAQVIAFLYIISLN